nr:putative ribonuclease H-like domain-containing protein [Tanacetum cinerariifolium]
SPVGSKANESSGNIATELIKPCTFGIQTLHDGMDKWDQSKTDHEYSKNFPILRVPSPVENYSDIGSPEVDRPPSPDYVPGPEEPEKAPLSPDYMPGLEEPEQAPPSPVYLPYVPEVVYPEYMPPEEWQRGDFIPVQVYVDDIIFGSSNPQLCREFKALMHEKFQMSAMGELNFFLGLQVLQKKDGIFLSQDKYVGDILKKFGYSDVRSSNTPMDKENPWGKTRLEKM